jgi:hypothetical protein
VGGLRHNKTLSARVLAKTVRSERRLGLEALEEQLEEADRERPRIRADCQGGARPCPFVSCRFNLYLDVTAAGSLMFNFPGLEVDQMVESCALDVAERGGKTMAEVGRLLNITRARVQQIEREALAVASARLSRDADPQKPVGRVGGHLDPVALVPAQEVEDGRSHRPGLDALEKADMSPVAPGQHHHGALDQVGPPGLPAPGQP